MPTFTTNTLGSDGFELKASLASAPYSISDPLTFNTLFSIEKDGIRVRLENHDPINGDSLDEGGHLIPFNDFQKLVDWLRSKKVIQ